MKPNTETVERTPVITRTPITYDMLPETGNPRYTTKHILDCERCGEMFIPRSPRTRFCPYCQKAHELEKAKERYINSGRKQTSAKNWKRINGKMVYVHVGYNQSGKNNNHYKNGTGIDWFANALKVLPEKCNRCGKTEKQLQKENPSKIRNLLLHHKDGNHNNNDPSNWEILCKGCHQAHHSVRGTDGRFVSNKG